MTGSASKDTSRSGAIRSSSYGEAAGSAPSLLFCTNYIDHILYHCLKRLASNVSLQILCSQQNDWTERLQERGQRLRILRPRSRFDRRYKAVLAEMFAERPWALVHCVHGNAELANLLQWAGKRMPVIGYRGYIGHLKFRENPSAYWSVRNPHIAGVVANSRAVKDYLESFKFLRPRNVHVINHGIDARWVAAQARPDSGLRARLGIGADAIIVASMANLRPYKRFDLCVAAAQRLADRPVHFVHLGEDRGWKQKAPKLDNLHFLGLVQPPWPVLAAADVFASTAHNEAFGRSVLEAMACGKPLIGSDTGGLPDLIEHDVNGRLFRSGDAQSFIDQILYYDQDRSALERHAAGARMLASTRFSSDVMARNYLDLYVQVLNRSAAA